MYVCMLCMCVCMYVCMYDQMSSNKQFKNKTFVKYVIIRLNAAAFIKFFVIRVRRL